ncbi:sodium/proline symporter [bacterium]|nr:sodium/proline symporter [bacterium]
MDNQTILILSFIAYSAFIIGVGLYSARLRKKTTDDFVLANRELGPWAAALSASASSESGWVMLGLVGEAFAMGMAAFWIVPGIAAGYLFNWFVLAERLRKHSHATGSVTLTQFLIHRFDVRSGAIRWISIIIVTASLGFYIAAQMTAAGKSFNAVFDLPYWLGVLAGAFIILAYTITGGFRAISWTDIIQALFMMIALIGMPLVMLNVAGGYGAIVDKIAATSPELLTFSGGKAGLALLGFVVGSLGIGLGYPGQPHVLARFMASKDTAVVNKARFIAMGWMVVTYIGAVFFGLFSRAYYGTLTDPEQALPLACGELLPPVLAGFVVAAIVAAICSTADSQLIVVSSTWSRDVFARGSEKTGETDGFAKYLRRDRTILIALAVLSVLLALTESRVVFWFVLYAWAGLGAGFGPVVILGLLWKRTNKAGAVAGMLTGALTVVIWRNVPALKSALYELVPAFVLATLAVVTVSLLTSSNENAEPMHQPER